MLNYVIKNAVAEGSEEVASDAINLLADVLISRDKSEWAQSVRAYMAAGYSEAEATGLAVKDQILSAGVDFLGGALSGGIMSGVSGVGHVMTNYQGGNQSEVTAPAGGEAGQTGSEILEQAAREMVGVERTGPVQQESNVRQESPRPSVRTGAPPFDKGGEGQVWQRTEAMQNASALVRASEAFGENGRKAFASAWDGQADSARYYAGF